METLNSFKGYGKVSEAEDLEYRRKTRRRLIITGVAAALLVLLIVGAVVGIVVSKRRGSDDGGGQSSGSTGGVAESIKAVCSVTHYPNSCFASLSAAAAAENISDFRDPTKLFMLSLRVARTQLSKAGSLPAELAASKLGGGLDNRTKEALRICEQLIEDAADLLNDTISRATSGSFKGSTTVVLRQWLSGALANQETCLDAVNEATNGRATDLRKKLQEELGSTSELTSNSLAIATGIVALLEKLTGGTHNRRKLLSSDEWEWVPQARKLLQLGGGNSPTTAPPGPAASGGGGGFDAVVAQDGTGTHNTIGEALAAAPRRSTTPFVIRVSAGKYTERVVVDKNMWNIVMIGDGIGKTVITGRRNFGIDGTATFDTATLSVDGQGFVGRDMTVENTAGPAGQQAVALRVKADRAVFFRCAFTAFQDTLYAHSLRQFYRECEISGTVDFMFGKAAAVFQKCNIMPRQPGANQQNMITAHGRTDPNEPTGFSIQGSRVAALDSVTAPTFLGRPWGAYSRAVFMTSEIGAVVDPRGWRSWDGAGTPPDTTVYGEYMNTGPGAATAGRVQWGGYKSALSEDEAQRYSVGAFIQGSEWLPSTVAYTLNV